MEHFEGKLDGVSINGVFYDVTSFVRTEKNRRVRVNTMGKSGTVKVTPEYGFTLVFPRKENAADNPNLERLENFTTTAHRTNGTFEVFPNCEILSDSESGNTPSDPNNITIVVACDRPY